MDRATLATAVVAATLAGMAPLAQSRALSAADTKAIDAVFADYDKPASPGCMLGVVSDGAFLYTRGYGRANIEHDVAFTPETVFDIGSTSKQFLATAILLLVEDGKVSLDDDVRKYLPEVPDYGQTITIRHLLTHTSGLRDYITLMTLAGWQMEDVTSPALALDLVSRQKALDFRPGAEFAYSNTGFFLASLIVERVVGQGTGARLPPSGSFGRPGCTRRDTWTTTRPSCRAARPGTSRRARAFGSRCRTGSSWAMAPCRHRLPIC